MLLMMLRAGFQESNRVIAGFNDKAKSTITVSALVLGVIVAGTRVSLGLGIENGAGIGFIDQLVPVVEIPVSTLMGAGISAIIVSIVASLVAIAAVRLDSPFGTNTILTRGMLDPTKFRMWSKTSKERIYKKRCEEYAKATLKREKVARWSGRATLIGQIALGAGVVLAAIASAGIFLA